MNFNITQTDLSHYLLDKQGSIILAVTGKDDIQAQCSQSKEVDEFVTRLIEQKDVTSKVGSTSVIPMPSGSRLIMVGFGEHPVKPSNFIKALNAAALALKTSPATTAAFDLKSITVEGKENTWMAQQTAQAFATAPYDIAHCKSKKEETSLAIESLTILADESLEKDVIYGQSVANGITLAKTLADLPPNIVTPSYLAKEAQRIAKEHPTFTTTIIDEEEMEELGMGSFLSVSKGSIEAGKLICMEYRGGKSDEAPHVFVGKGITFDSGGISLKPGAGMDEMKYDMGGAASVLGAAQSIAEINLPINFVAVIAAAENMPAGNASKPGDIVTAMNGTTIEILNTDAEGRLVLCDALTYAINTYKPASIVDIATLTGACLMALGSVNSGLMTEDETMATDLLLASEQASDAVWRLPLQDEYQELLDSNFADIANIGGRLAGATTAACFLSRFTKGTPWAHLDVAGTAWNSGGKNKGATGRPVPLLLSYLKAKV